MTIEQVRELQKFRLISVTPSWSLLHYDNDGADEWFLTIVDDYADSEFADIENIPTSQTIEMLEMLPTETCLVKRIKE